MENPEKRRGEERRGEERRGEEKRREEKRREEKRREEKRKSPYFTLIGELGGGDVQLLVLLLQFREFGLQLGLVQLGVV